MDTCLIYNKKIKIYMKYIKKGFYFCLFVFVCICFNWIYIYLFIYLYMHLVYLIEESKQFDDRNDSKLETNLQHTHEVNKDDENFRSNFLQYEFEEQKIE